MSAGKRRVVRGEERVEEGWRTLQEWDDEGCGDLNIEVRHGGTVVWLRQGNDEIAVQWDHFGEFVSALEWEYAS